MHHDEHDCRVECKSGSDIAALKAAVFGNGHPEESLLARTHTIEKQIASVSKVAWTTLFGVSAILGKLILAIVTKEVL